MKTNNKEFEGLEASTIAPPMNIIVKEDWKEKIRQDYKGIVSDEQIEATIRYWDKFLKENFTPNSLIEKCEVCGRCREHNPN